MDFISALQLLIGLMNLLLLSDCEKIKLVGPTRCSGRVEVFHRDSWGTVCDDHWSISNAEVVCREMDCGTVIEAKTGAFFGEGKEHIWLDDVQCTGSESSILKCPHRTLGINNCGHGEDAGVVCSDFVRLVNGSNRCNGRVELYQGGHWKKVCSSDWTKEDADVVCREISCGSPLSQTVPSHFGEAHNLNGVKTHCVGNESSISECTHQDTSESCTDATVVCTSRPPSPGAFFGEGQGDIWLDDVNCFGNETSLQHCRRPSFGENNCGHSEDAGVVCSGMVYIQVWSMFRYGMVYVLVWSMFWYGLCSGMVSSGLVYVLCQYVYVQVWYGMVYVLVWYATIRLINVGRMSVLVGSSCTTEDHWASASSVNWE
ncbi:deleted in malignant brain tumors 1 protein-like [Acanthochromis polyacanthus]|uniref:deleted in malignant brain tumors 1 protein-like n=1 Tax=Acanthochromis polyacanthus TaxID=80966 RepID=UPI002234BD58|nr:deleted in malignant brain tumors 1 protein-like [Acanthochromis polyacanthus]